MVPGGRPAGRPAGGGQRGAESRETRPAYMIVLRFRRHTRNHELTYLIVL